MPVQSTWMIRFSLIWLLISVLIGGLLLIQKVTAIHPGLWALLLVHYELAIWGWLVQFVMGTAYWMFPRRLAGKLRGPIIPAWLMVVSYNTGLVLLIGASLNLQGLGLAAAGRLLMMFGVVVFAYLIWGRAVSYRNRI